MFENIFKSEYKEPEKCESCYGSGKSQAHLFNFGRGEAGIIKRNFPKFNPRKSCEHCFGDGRIYPHITKLTDYELHVYMQNKIWSRRSRRK